MRMCSVCALPEGDKDNNIQGDLLTFHSLGAKANKSAKLNKPQLPFSAHFPFSNICLRCIKLPRLLHDGCPRNSSSSSYIELFLPDYPILRCCLLFETLEKAFLSRNGLEKSQLCLTKILRRLYFNWLCRGLCHCCVEGCAIIYYILFQCIDFS